ncbi:hsf-type dna-binding [Plasmopara halstedii]|uniref:Hsf-type dna-binding n=1 Tax=Plasmopara halstedii TaxID=4781 RepID=A0A0P1AQ73_PLAHL|nr:hsf-type dna-binding [Plasmopara halstedii]CEG43254.1 hsf-type dna-binding [Plasmopara halstedii]|eukprot:XP_024579623.1 hsf-type dna-binding [Plasmopara halstedii]
MPSYSLTKETTTPREVAPFLKSLRRMLLDESEAVMRWTPDGRAFEIHDMQEMTARVLPKYFKHCKYTSFQRQLNYFSFRKWTKSKAVVCTFSNDCFLRDQPELAWHITRKKSLSPLALPKYKLGAAARSLVIPYWQKASAPSPILSSLLSAGNNCGRLFLPAAASTDVTKLHDKHYVQPAQVSCRYNSFNVAASLPSESHIAANAGEQVEAFDWIDCLLPPSEDAFIYMYPLASPYPRTLRKSLESVQSTSL